MKNAIFEDNSYDFRSDLYFPIENLVEINISNINIENPNLDDLLKLLKYMETQKKELNNNNQIHDSASGDKKSPDNSPVNYFNDNHTITTKNPDVKESCMLSLKYLINKLYINPMKDFIDSKQTDNISCYIVNIIFKKFKCNINCIKYLMVCKLEDIIKKCNEKCNENIMDDQQNYL
ncbi:hypothetical protein BCR32DRAFT_324583 [Anaeromyces robustus]|uniref:Uncharacterized protein n=1 Tax=Anaeromyces robustus TaxID=1754192 RepID=A0A1Y1XNC2_9FUNG|nr:hypothetical protein BCR32DRAFT_324583 [Anaeromyces robustus]|eukprot:ORX87248.1 hypothetical protein BCR32DRAFT_324583 [Anaeromyces robustus]